MISFLVFSFFISVSSVADRSQNLDFWIQSLESSKIDIQINALQKLAEIKAEKSVPYIGRSLNSERSQIRFQSAVSLSKLPYQQSLDLLADRSRIEKDVYVKAEINRAIRRLKEFFESKEPALAEPENLEE